jgi:hypothetical protein
VGESAMSSITFTTDIGASMYEWLNVSVKKLNQENGTGGEQTP